MKTSKKKKKKNSEVCPFSGFTGIAEVRGMPLELALAEGAEPATARRVSKANI